MSKVDWYCHLILFHLWWLLTLSKIPVILKEKPENGKRSNPLNFGSLKNRGPGEQTINMKQIVTFCTKSHFSELNSRTESFCHYL